MIGNDNKTTFQNCLQKYRVQQQMIGKHWGISKSNVLGSLCLNHTCFKGLRMCLFYEQRNID